MGLRLALGDVFAAAEDDAEPRVECGGRSEWPKIVQPIPKDTNIGAVISPVNALLGSEKMFCAETPQSGSRLYLTSGRKIAGEATTTPTGVAISSAFSVLIRAGQSG
jgi:hypothetical protein